LVTKVCLDHVLLEERSANYRQLGHDTIARWLR